MSAEISTTGFLLVFFHQCDRPPCSTDSSPVLCTMGTWQWLEYSVMRAGHDVDQRGPLAVAVPGHFTAGLDVEAAHAQVMTGDGDLLLGEVDLAEQFFRHVLVSSGAGLLAVGRFLAGGAGAGKGGSGNRQCAGDQRGENEAEFGRGHGSILCKSGLIESEDDHAHARRMPGMEH